MKLRPARLTSRTLLGTVAACQLFAVSTLYAQKQKLPDGPGKETTEKICGACHGAEIVMSHRESREGWSGIVEDMIQRGAKGTDEEFDTVVEYLATHFSKDSAAPKASATAPAEHPISTSAFAER